MEMIRHQNIGVEIKRIALTNDAQGSQKCLVVALSKKYLLPIIAARHHVVEQTFSVDSGMAGHGLALTELIDLGKSDTLLAMTRCLQAQYRNRKIV